MAADQRCSAVYNITTTTTKFGVILHTANCSHRALCYSYGMCVRRWRCGEESHVHYAHQEAACWPQGGAVQRNTPLHRSTGLEMAGGCQSPNAQGELFPLSCPLALQSAVVACLHGLLGESQPRREVEHLQGTTSLRQLRWLQVPYGNSFHSHLRWAARSIDGKHTHLKITCQVRLHAGCLRI